MRSRGESEENLRILDFYQKTVEPVQRRTAEKLVYFNVVVMFIISLMQFSIILVKVIFCVLKETKMK